MLSPMLLAGDVATCSIVELEVLYSARSYEDLVTRGIVEAHGGRIWIESLPSRGTRFSFTLPKAAVTATGIR